MSINEEKVEDNFERIRDSVSLATRLDLEHLEALIERMRIELILKTLDRDRRNVYRSVIDLLEAELEARHEAMDEDRAAIRKKVMAYIRRVMQNLSDAMD